jgi:hypothetical protein
MKTLTTKFLPFLSASLAITGVFTAVNALGAFSAPYQWKAEDSTVCNTVEPGSKPVAAQKVAKKASQDFARFRPVDRFEIAKDADALLTSKTSIEALYDKEFTKHIQSEYNNRVAYYERVVETPYRKADTWDYSRYNNSRNDLAKWMTREILNDQMKSFFQRGDKASAPMQVLSTMRELSGGNPTEEETNRLTPEQKIARAHRLDLPKVEEEEYIPTRLKTKMNMLKGTGQLRFQNPVVETSLNVSARGDDRVSVDMNKDFKKLTMKSNLRYGVQKRMVQMNVNKKITDEVSLDLSSERYTGGKRGAGGEKSREAAKLTYSLSF